MKVTATATRRGGSWVVEVPGVEGVLTQARRLDQVSAIVAEAVHLVQGVRAEDVEVELDYEIGDSAALMEARAAHLQVESAAHAQECAARASRAAVAHLRRSGLSVRDIGVILDLSPQRVSQLDRAGIHA
ncbi:hypothetical protein ACWEK5_13995 [Rhodococcus koreensis]|uniref:hypothetical protein n=1 Tax=Rhodococcus sp. T2V TaxID=3034164 RepID=UPI0023E29B2A|nr:hypothetical protein [Rhodococcus sp. T2V]MDF3313134.1 hypothetical protein [Rhodococcus sp. T2V]